MMMVMAMAKLMTMQTEINDDHRQRLTAHLGSSGCHIPVSLDNHLTSVCSSVRLSVHTSSVRPLAVADRLLSSNYVNPVLRERSTRLRLVCLMHDSLALYSHLSSP